MFSLYYFECMFYLYCLKKENLLFLKVVLSLEYNIVGVCDVSCPLVNGPCIKIPLFLVISVVLVVIFNPVASIKLSISSFETSRLSLLI
ncbi:MAG: hypothetical protein HRU03_08550 [Nanoarchaeales archaeon]|nr:hypothetical protein [Nanoarchaeales archaeon]